MMRGRMLHTLQCDMRQDLALRCSLIARKFWDAEEVQILDPDSTRGADGGGPGILNPSIWVARRLHMDS